jgi:signal transduction histidine kinase
VKVSAAPGLYGHGIIWEDNGKGIPAEEKERIFERGYGKNTGLGLFLVREILGITDITIAEAGTEGRGARFEMTVPHGAYHAGHREDGGP